MMKFLFSLILVTLVNTGTPWLTDFEKAKVEAVQSHRLILLSFSGSDWCIPCIKLRDQIFESAMFEKYADSSLVLVNADFPRLKKNKLSAELTKRNESLADRFNAHGTFPLTLLLDARGKVLKTWEGFPDKPADKFVDEIKSLANDSK